jgi:ABC-type branched-subunit amino acid transport system permease subunit
VALASPLGEALAGIKTRETRLEFMGVSAKRVLLSAYVASASTRASASTAHCAASPSSACPAKRTGGSRIPSVAALLAGTVGLAVGLFVVRYREIFFGMLNLALSMVFRTPARAPGRAPAPPTAPRRPPAPARRNAPAAAG